MRGFGPFTGLLILLAGCCLRAAAAAPESLVFASSSNTLLATAAGCEQPEPDVPDFPASNVHPIWRVDLGYIADAEWASLLADRRGYRMSGNELRRLTTVGSADLDIPEGAMGLRLGNGWSLGFTYELLDARFKFGPFLLPEPDAPVFEGPKFVATLKFR